jgi:hypothetical protein
MDASFWVLPAVQMRYLFFCNMVWYNWVFGSPNFKTPRVVSPSGIEMPKKECQGICGCMNIYRDAVIGDWLTGWMQSVL